MKTMSFTDRIRNVNLEYILIKAQTSSNSLVVSFPALDGELDGEDWGYLFTLSKLKNVHLLFLRADHEYAKSRMTLRNGKPVIEEVVTDLVKRCMNDLGANQVIAVGTSMGGWCSLYFGLKNNWNIISGSPVYTFRRMPKESIEYAMGGENNDGEKRLNELMNSAIFSAQNNGYDRKCFITYGEGEEFWKDKLEGPRMLETMDRANIPYTLSLYPFSDHQSICDIFPLILTEAIKYFQGEVTNPDEKIVESFISSEQKILNEIDRIHDDVNYALEGYKDERKKGVFHLLHCIRDLCHEWANGECKNFKEILDGFQIPKSLFHDAREFLDDTCAYSTIVSSSINIVHLLIEYHFDRNGWCISGQCRSQDVILQALINFLDALSKCNIPDDKALRKLHRKCDKIMKFAAHIAQPNEVLVPIGETRENEQRITKKRVKRVAGNYIKRTSNIAFLEDPSTESYITINGGSNIRSSCRHCDLLSYTWFYAGERVFCDAGGDDKSYRQYAASAVAHNGFLCDYSDYITPSYDDWTSIDKTGLRERADCVIVPTSHHLIDGVSMRRKFIYIMPNIMVLIDEGISEVERQFVQNFLLDNGTVEEEDLCRTKIRLKGGLRVFFSQYDISKRISFSKFYGTGRRENPRGCIIEKEGLRGALNLAYAKSGTAERFVTAIEIHSEKFVKQERSIRSLSFNKHERFVIHLENGTIISETNEEELQ